MDAGHPAGHVTVEPHPQFKTESTEESVVKKKKKKVSPNRLALRFNQDCQASEDKLSFGDTSIFVHHEHSGR